MKCFYHNDADGKCAGFWVAHTAVMENIETPTEFIEMSYEKPFPMDMIKPNERIYIVDYSISPGIISSTRCASLATIVPCAIGLLACACMPDAVVWLTQLPNVVIGLILSYVVILQLAAAFSMMSEKKIAKSFDHALTIALPLIVALLVAFIPPTVGEDLPIALRPILTNGFVIGVLLVVFLEHIVFLRKE